MTGKNVRVNKLILEVVEKQLKENTPRQTRETLERLQHLGFSEDDAKHLIGSAMVAEMRAVVGEGRSFSEERYLALLHRLPELP
jgi:hypothetical protein